MSDYPVVGLKEVVETVNSGEAHALTDINNVEAALEMIKSYEVRIKDLKDFKQKKMNIIDQEIESANSRIEFLRSVICETLKQSDKKSVNFPGFAKASRRTKKGNWIINDEAALIEVLKEEKEFDNCVEIKQVIKKGDVNKLLDVWNEVKKVPDCVEKTPDSESLTISFEAPTTNANDVPVAKKQKTNRFEDQLEELDFN